MSSREKPSTATIKRIYFALVRKPCSFEDLIDLTGINETALDSALRFLKAKGMIVSYNFTNRLMFRMVRTKPLRYGWNFPWLDLMMSADDWKTPWKQVQRKTEEDEKLDKRFVNLLKDLLVDPNLDFIEVWKNLT